MSQDQIAETNMGSKYFGRMEQLKYLGTILINQNSIHEASGADRSQGMPAIIQCRIFVFQFTI
jgi:hypothetical protein